MSAYRFAGEEMVKAIDRLSTKLNQMALDEVSETGQQHDKTLMVSVFAMIGILTVAALISLLLASLIVKPIRALQQTMQQVASGNLLVNAEVEGKMKSRNWRKMSTAR